MSQLLNFSTVSFLSPINNKHPAIKVLVFSYKLITRSKFATTLLVSLASAIHQPLARMLLPQAAHLAHYRSE